MNTALKAAPGTVAISDDEMRRFAPSIFASQPIEGVSEKYSFLPTSSILNGMRENGWVPVRAQEQSIRTEARRGFQKHVVRFARVEHLQTWEKNQVRPEVVLVNSHDKSSAYQLHCGLFRLVCTNGMVVSDGTFQRMVMEGGTTFYFVTGGIEEALRLAKTAAGDKDVKIGGGISTVRQYLRGGMIDSLHLAFAPVVLGQGEALFRDLDLPALGFSVTAYEATEQATHIVLEKTAS
jgi:hypothetical protein